MGSSTFSFAHVIDAFRDMIEKMNTPNHKKGGKKYTFCLAFCNFIWDNDRNSHSLLSKLQHGENG